MFSGRDSADFGEFITEEAKMAPFRITVTEQGTLDSMKNSTLTNSVEGSTTILTIVPEGTEVSGPVRTEFAGTVSLNADDSESEKAIIVTEDDGTTHTYGLTIGEFTRLVVQDGDVVKKNDILGGDVVCELDASNLVDKERTQQISVTQTKANLDKAEKQLEIQKSTCLLYTSPSPRDATLSRMPSSA